MRSADSIGFARISGASPTTNTGPTGDRIGRSYLRVVVRPDWQCGPHRRKQPVEKVGWAPPTNCEVGGVKWFLVGGAHPTNVSKWEASSGSWWAVPTLQMFRSVFQRGAQPRRRPTRYGGLRLFASRRFGCCHLFAHFVTLLRKPGLP